jgi:hypothetical protein
MNQLSFRQLVTLSEHSISAIHKVALGTQPILLVLLMAETVVR